MVNNAYLAWQRSSRCSETGCVEIARVDDARVLIRDSKLLDASPLLEFSARQFAEFVDGVRLGEFD